MQRVREEGAQHQNVPSVIHFVETAPSILHEMPWIITKDPKVDIKNVNFTQTIHVVYGEAGTCCYVLLTSPHVPKFFLMTNLFHQSFTLE
jgi:hypothetical protein